MDGDAYRGWGITAPKSEPPVDLLRLAKQVKEQEARLTEFERTLDRLEEALRLILMGG